MLLPAAVRLGRQLENYATAIIVPAGLAAYTGGPVKIAGCVENERSFWKASAVWATEAIQHGLRPAPARTRRKFKDRTAVIRTADHGCTVKDPCPVES